MGRHELKHVVSDRKIDETLLAHTHAIFVLAMPIVSQELV